jgi:hypothetical protein
LWTHDTDVCTSIGSGIVDEERIGFGLNALDHGLFGPAPVVASDVGNVFVTVAAGLPDVLNATVCHIFLTSFGYRGSGLWA